jgi:hypothetical protein
VGSLSVSPCLLFTLPASQLVPFYQAQLILASICLGLLTGMSICFFVGIWRSCRERRVW